MTTIVEPRPCKTCGESANYIGTSATGTAFACPACATTSWYYEDESAPQTFAEHTAQAISEWGRGAWSGLASPWSLTGA